MTGHEADMERTFAALPPAQGRAFAQTWWGLAWLRALEDAALDARQVKTGRRLARAGAVGAVSVRPGRITAIVHDRDRTGHRADVLLSELSDRQWDRFLDLAVERSGHVAALLDREMPTQLVEDAETAGIDLLPGLGDLEPQCDCDAWDHCGHTAALCYQVARLLDQDPFVLLLMRGRDARSLTDALRARSAAAADSPAEPGETEGTEGTDAVEAYAVGDLLPPLPGLPELPPRPGLPPSLDTGTPPGSGVDPTALRYLAALTAVEARRLLVQALRPASEQRDPLPELTVAQDAVRLAVGSPDQGVPDRQDTTLPDRAVTERLDVDPPDPAITVRLVAGSGRDPEALARATRAWRLGGVAALSVLEEEWTVSGEALARARAAVAAAWDEDERPPLRARANRWTVVGAETQLRLDRDGRWWPYRKERGRWEPAGPASLDPATALASLDHP
ncbi:SWF or SNF family helicase [Streptomyces sp. NPDC047072]|uniref:SWIM zinc finger family protein n=1 Tax=Streptomyces sp. NPDC047072 TaxID=3154809 RepID=UPI0033C31FEE